MGWSSFKLANATWCPPGDAAAPKTLRLRTGRGTQCHRAGCARIAHPGNRITRGALPSLERNPIPITPRKGTGQHPCPSARHAVHEILR